MNIPIVLIVLGIGQLTLGGFYGMVAPIRVEESIDFNLAKAQQITKEILTEKISPEFAQRWPKEFELEVQHGTWNAHTLADLAREGWDALEKTSLILVGSGILTSVLGLLLLRQNQTGIQPEINRPPCA